MAQAAATHEEEALGKAYDARLMRRLLAYLRPHRTRVVTAVIVLLTAAAVELTGPILTKIALDRTNPSRVIARARVTSDVPIRVDSYATLEPQGITGVNYIQITAGTPSKPLLKDVERQKCQRLGMRVLREEGIFELLDGPAGRV